MVELHCGCEDADDFPFHDPFAGGGALLRGLLELDAIDPADFPWDPSVGDAFQNREKELTARVDSFHERLKIGMYPRAGDD